MNEPEPSPCGKTGTVRARRLEQEVEHERQIAAGAAETVASLEQQLRDRILTTELHTVEQHARELTQQLALAQQREANETAALLREQGRLETLTEGSSRGAARKGAKGGGIEFRDVSPSRAGRLLAAQRDRHMADETVRRMKEEEVKE